MELLLLFALFALGGIIAPLLAWASDEASHRARWLSWQRSTETHSLGAGAFRRTDVAASHAQLLRDRAPGRVRAVALTCYLPASAALVAAIPWLLGLLILAEGRLGGDNFDRWVNAVLAPVYPFGCWAAARMFALGAALLSGDAARFRGALRRAAAVALPLNAAIVAAALWLRARFATADALWLLLGPALTLAQLALVAVAGRAIAPAEASAPPPPDAARTADAAVAP